MKLRRGGSVITAIIAFLLAFGFFTYNYFFVFVKDEPRETIPVEEGELIVYIFDVGQADCTLIRSEEGDILIDAGDKKTQNEIVDMILATGVTELEYVIFTHPDSDHIGGANEVIEGIDVNYVILPDLHESDVPGTVVYREMEEAIDAKENSGDLQTLSAVSGTVYELGDLRMKILAPNDDDYDNINNYSVSVRFDYGETSFLFTGDALEESELEMLATYPVSELDCTFFQAGHHGAANANTLAFISAVTPEIVAVSCGKDNKYGHPTSAALEAYESVGAIVYRTDELGTIVFVSDGMAITQR